jgi:hypothetical protein
MNPIHFLPSIIQKPLRRDYSDLLTHGKMLEAEKLSRELSTLLGVPFYFSHFGDPHYPVQNVESKTVFVHLNPGSGLGKFGSESDFFAQRWNRNYFFERNGLGEQADIEDVLNAYEQGWKNYAFQRFVVKGETDNFDYKQACFLLHWTDSGIDLKLGDFSDRVVQQFNTINVLNQKLQLELFPYGSNTIDTALLLKAFELEPDLLSPYIENMLTLITLHPRKYVLFGSRVFQQLFRAYHIRVKAIILQESHEIKIQHITKNSLSFSCMRLHWKNQTIDAGIAHSFARRDLPNAYQKMAAYGQACYHYFKQHHQV